MNIHEWEHESTRIIQRSKKNGEKIGSKIEKKAGGRKNSN